MVIALFGLVVMMHSCNKNNIVPQEPFYEIEVVDEYNIYDGDTVKIINKSSCCDAVNYYISFGDTAFSLIHGKYYYNSIPNDTVLRVYNKGFYTITLRIDRTNSIDYFTKEIEIQ